VDPQLKGRRAVVTGSSRGIADAITADGGSADILVNNTGAFGNRSWAEATPEDWLDLYAVNVAAVRCIQGFLPGMRATRWGRVIQIGTGEAIIAFAASPLAGYINGANLHRRRQHRRHLNREERQTLCATRCWAIRDFGSVRSR
jgi:NAD(P)-dependent dehydrogenase (short-subunit alcohol dehydrogenase family)